MLTTFQIFDGLNEAQKIAVTALEGPVLIAAGPGTGKTLTIVRRIAHLVQQGVNPENILAVTFTNRAAREMLERADVLLGNDSGNIFICTFHFLGLRIIQDFSSANFKIYNRDEQMSLLKPLLKGSNIKPQEAIDKISRIKNLVEDTDGEMKKICDDYQAALNEKSALDFDDLILKPIEILCGTDNRKTTVKYKNTFKYIIIDEYQDINPSQYRMLRLLANENVCAVGDSDQAIYTFRGAEVSNFLNFEKDFKNAKRIMLTENYRSTGVIINASNNLIKNNQNRIDKGIHPAKGEGRLITIVSAPDEKAEGEFIVREIEGRIGGTSHYQMMHLKEMADFSGEPYSFSDFAVIYRTNAQARAIEDAFAASGIPYQVIGRGGSKQGKEIEDTVAYMKSFMPSEEIAAPEHAPLEEKLLTPADMFDPRADAVALMTLHMAKGLEFRVVFIAGAEEGLMPYTLKKESVDIEEERRLFYVGMTRAKEELFLIHARERFLYGERLSQRPSLFLKEIPEGLIQEKVIPDRIKKQKEEKQIGLF